MLDMGFRPQIDAILRHVPTKRQTMLFSATMPNGVHAMALRIMNDPVWVEAAPQATVAANVEQMVYSVRKEKKPALLLRWRTSRRCPRARRAPPCAGSRP